MEYVLKTTELTKIYNHCAVVDHVNMQINQGDIYGFIGRNGAGKTTLMRLIMNLAAPSSGQFSLFGGENIQTALRRIGCAMEAPALYPGMTAQQNLQAWRMTQGLSDRSEVARVLEMVGLADVKTKKVKNFSMGMKQRLSIAMALLGKSEFLMLDEPMNGLDPEGIKQLRELLLYLNQHHGITILMSSHMLEELSKIATCYGIIQNGKLVRQFSKDTLEASCQQYIQVTVQDLPGAKAALESMPSVQNYQIMEQGIIRIFDCADQIAQINAKLVHSNVLVDSIGLSGESLEEFFIDLTGVENQPVKKGWHTG